MEIKHRLYDGKYHRTKVKELLKGKRKSIAINGKYETTTVTGIPINKNGKPYYSSKFN